MADDGGDGSAGGGGTPSLPDAAKVALAGIAVISAVTGVVGGLTGGVARLARNSPPVLPAATALTFLAAGLAVTATLVGPAAARRTGDAVAEDPAPPPDAPRKAASNALRADRWQASLVLGSLIVFGIAATLVAWRLSTSLATPDRPMIAAKWTTVGARWALSGTVTASGLQTDDQLAVAAFRMVGNGYPRPPSPKPTVVTGSPGPWWTPPPHWMYRTTMTYEQIVGADIDGTVSVAFEVPLADGYDGLQVVATLQTVPAVEGHLAPRYDCQPGQAMRAPAQRPVVACLTIDAPEAAPAASSAA